MMMAIKKSAQFIEKRQWGKVFKLAGVSLGALFLLSSSALPAATPDRPAEFDAAAAGKFLLLDFYTPYCGTCRMMEPYVSALPAKAQGKLNLERVDISQSKNRKYVNTFSIASTPTYVLFNPAGKAVYKMENTISPSILEKNVLQQIHAAEVTVSPVSEKSRPGPAAASN
jgi:thioredoxin 1